MNAPNISRLIQRQPNQPVLVLSSEGDAGGNAGGDALVAGQFVQPDRNSQIEGPWKTYSAAVRVHHQGVAAFGELDSGIQASDAKRNLGPNSGTAPS